MLLWNFNWATCAGSTYLFLFFFLISTLGLHQNDQFYIKEMLDTYIMIHIKGNTGIEGWCIFSNNVFDSSDVSNYMIMVNFCKSLNQVCLYQFCENC